MQDATRLRIRRVFHDGAIGIETGSRYAGGSWTDSPERWAERVRGRKLYLLEAAPDHTSPSDHA